MGAAQIGISVLAVATIFLMTIPAGFDTTSAISLSIMHLVVAIAAVTALRAKMPRRPR